jgi:ribosomal protein S18 acetylase RimI-like enzyme
MFKEELLQFIEKNNTREKGLAITIPIVDYVDKLVNNANIIVHIESNQLVGVMAYYANNATYGFLTLALIDENYQGKGIGKRLLQYSMNDLKLKNIKIFKLEVLKSNEKAIQFYKKLNFDIVQEKLEFFIMEKQLW